MKTQIIAGIIGIAAAGAAAIGLKMYHDYKERQVEVMANGIEIEVDGDLVKEAIDRRIDKIVRREVDATAAQAVAQVRSDIRREVKDSVNLAYSDLKNDVEKELTRQVGEVDISDIRKEVVRKAKERAAEKFDSDLKSVLEAYNRDLENISKIYSSIAEKMDTTGNKEKSVNLNIG